MGRLTREAPLPREMQGRWAVAGEASSELIVDGGEITCFGRTVDYDYKEVIEEDGALTVSLATQIRRQDTCCSIAYSCRAPTYDELYPCASAR